MSKVSGPNGPGSRPGGTGSGSGETSPIRVVSKLRPPIQASPAPVLAIAKGESNFNPDAVSAPGRGPHADPMAQNRRPSGISPKGGSFQAVRQHRGRTPAYFAELMDLYGDDVFMSLAAYNYGPTALSKGTIPQKSRLVRGLYHTINWSSWFPGRGAPPKKGFCAAFPLLKKPPGSPVT